MGTAFLAGVFFGIMVGLLLAYCLGSWAVEQRKKRVSAIARSMTPEQRNAALREAQERIDRDAGL